MKGKLNFQKLAIAIVASFVFVAAFEMLWHGHLMKGMYDATARVWRPMSECNMLPMFGAQALFAVVLSLIYTQVGHHLACKHGVAFGLGAGALLAAPTLGTYCYLPIPFKITALWMLACLLKSLGSGMVIAFFYKK